MPFSDFLFLLQWYGVLTALGVLVLPVTFFLFPRFFDRGYIFSKVIGMILVAYLMFAFGTLHALPFTTASLQGIIFLMAIGSAYLVWKRTDAFLAHIRSIWKIILIEEILFFLSLWFWTFVRGHQPNINGLEKFMDYGFVNSILRGRYFPPKDMWLPPFSINYYYFGHLTTAVLTKLTMLPSYITFNLMLATLFAFCLVCSFSVGGNLLYFLSLSTGTKLNWRKWTRISVGALVIAYLTTLAGNLHMLYGFFKPYVNEQPVPLWQLPFMPAAFPNGYWYPNATRFIYHTIHEFPLYSFVVSDLHGHVLDIPFVLLTLAVFFSILIKSQARVLRPELTPKGSTKSETMLKNKNIKSKTVFDVEHMNFRFVSSFVIRISDLLIVSFLLSVMYMTNAWDGLIYLLFAFFVFVYLRTMEFSKGKRIWVKIGNALVRDMVLIIIGFFVFTFPFSHYFEPLKIATGIGMVCPPQFLVKIGKIGPFVFEADHCQHSPFWQLAILYGFFYFWVMSFIVYFFLRPLPKNKKQLNPADVFVFLLIIVGTLMIIAPEFVYLKDIYATYFRANTMFKLVYQSFIILSIASGYAIVRFISLTTIKEKIFLIPYILVGGLFLAVVAIYPFMATGSYYNNLKTYDTLNGVKYLNTQYPTDAKAITWINENIQGQPVILEAQGDSYTDYARVSANTGLPTVLGWPVHEWLWRGTYDVASPRIADIQTMYESPDINTTKDLLKKYNVSYIFIGDLERKKYHLNEDKFTELGNIIYRNNTTLIYQLHS